MRVGPTRYRVPDVVVVDRTRQVEQIPTHPPIAVFEVLSPEDTTSRLLAKLEDYEQMGTPGVFVVNPHLERAYRYVTGELRLSEPVLPLEGSEAILDWKAISGLRD